MGRNSLLKKEGIGLENDVILSPAVIPYDEFFRYKNTLPYYKNIAEEGKKIG